LQRRRDQFFSTEKGSKLFERSEFLIPPLKKSDRGKLSRAKPGLQGAFSFGSFSLRVKENEQLQAIELIKIYLSK